MKSLASDSKVGLEQKGYHALRRRTPVYQICTKRGRCRDYNTHYVSRIDDVISESIVTV